MYKISKSQLLSALSAAEIARSESPNVPRPDLTKGSSGNQRALEKLLRPALTKAGFDLKSFDKILKQHEAERGRIMEKD